MAESQDTEITLGAGKILVMFFGLVALCSVFFGLGYKVGKVASPSSGSDPSSATTSSSGTARPSATKISAPAMVDKPAPPPTTPAAAEPTTTKVADTASQQAAASDSTSTGDPTTAPPTTGYFVQVAAVSKQEDAEALVDALKRKQYAAAANSMNDKLFHIQVGPFVDIKDAELTRAKLVADGYNPILKK